MVSAADGVLGLPDRAGPRVGGEQGLDGRVRLLRDAEGARRVALALVLEVHPFQEQVAQAALDLGTLDRADVRDLHVRVLPGDDLQGRVRAVERLRLRAHQPAAAEEEPAVAVGARHGERAGLPLQLQELRGTRRG